MVSAPFTLRADFESVEDATCRRPAEAIVVPTGDDRSVHSPSLLLFITFAVSMGLCIFCTLMKFYVFSGGLLSCISRYGVAVLCGVGNVDSKKNFARLFRSISLLPPPPTYCRSFPLQPSTRTDPYHTSLGESPNIF